MKAGGFYLNIKTKTFWIQALPLLQITQFLGFLFWPGFPEERISCPGLTPAFRRQPHPTLTWPRPSTVTKGTGPLIPGTLSIAAVVIPSSHSQLQVPREASCPPEALSASMSTPAPSWPLHSPPASS